MAAIPSPTDHVVVVGAGILGAATAHTLLERGAARQVSVLEKEDRPAAHQTGRNSGVIHAGLYYAPGSLKARLCRRGVELLSELCERESLPYQEIGKVLVALDADEEARLDGIEERARANGVPDVRRLTARELTTLEPRVTGREALHSPRTAITDYAAVTRRLLELVRAGGGRLRLGTRVSDLALRGGAGGCVVVTVRDADGVHEVVADRVVLAGGLHSDQLARRAGGSPGPRIVPFRGEYLALREPARDLVNGLVYPVPDPRYPFLGVHVTPTVDGRVLLGPGAVLALAREGYGWGDLVPAELGQTLTWPGFWPFAARHWRTGVTEVAASLSRRRFVAQARRYLPGLSLADVAGRSAGVRAQAMARDGSLVDDFVVEHLLDGRVTALRNAPSPAATSSLAIAEHLVEEMAQRR